MSNIKWTQSEKDFLISKMSRYFEMDHDIKDTDRIDFMGCCLQKLDVDLFGLMEWDYDSHCYSFRDAWYVGTLEKCTDKIIELEGVEA